MTIWAGNICGFVGNYFAKTWIFFLQLLLQVQQSYFLNNTTTLSMCNVHSCYLWFIIHYDYHNINVFIFIMNLHIWPEILPHKYSFILQIYFFTISFLSWITFYTFKCWNQCWALYSIYKVSFAQKSSWELVPFTYILQHTVQLTTSTTICQFPIMVFITLHICNTTSVSVGMYVCTLLVDWISAQLCKSMI